MMYGRGKSNSAIVAAKLVNKAGRLAAELVERRAGAKGKAAQRNTSRAQDRESVSQALDRIRKVAKERKKEKFTALFHHLSLDLLEQAFFELKDNAAPGVDGLTWTDYEADLERNLEGLFSRLHRGAYRAMPSRRVYIPKPDGRQRPLAVTALEDKVVQRATAAILNAIYEEDFASAAVGISGATASRVSDAIAKALVLPLLTYCPKITVLPVKLRRRSCASGSDALLIRFHSIQCRVDQNAADDFHYFRMPMDSNSTRSRAK